MCTAGLTHIHTSWHLYMHTDTELPLYFRCGQPLQAVHKTGVEELEVIREKYACLPVMSVIGSSTSKSRPVRMIRIKPAPIWKP